MQNFQSVLDHWAGHVVIAYQKVVEFLFRDIFEEFRIGQVDSFVYRSVYCRAKSQVASVPLFLRKKINKLSSD